MSTHPSPAAIVRRAVLASAFAALWACLAACASSAAFPKLGSPFIEHVMFITLNNPGEAAAMKADSDAVIPKIPGVRGYACGSHIEVGRKNVRKDYTLGILVQFSSVEDYKTFQANPEHIALVNKWKPRWLKSEMFDFGSL